MPTAAPTQKTPTEEPPVVKAPIPGPPTPTCLLRWRQAERETANLGLNRLRLVRKQNSDRPDPQNVPVPQSRRCEAGLALPFPLQDTEGRLASIMRLYEHAGEQPPPQDGVAGEAIRHLHSHMLPRDARHLRNQVVCMIAEYHLTSSARVSLTLSPVLPEAKPLLPALKMYVPNISFKGTQDVRVLDRAKAL